MNDAKAITKEAFVKRLAALSLKSGLAGFPKDETDRHILLKSAMLGIESGKTHTEKEINAALEGWVLSVARIPGIDRTTLRRALVDAGYLLRSANGASYQVAQPGPQPELFEAAVDKVDPAAAIAAAQEEIEARKRAFMQKRP